MKFMNLMYEMHENKWLLFPAKLSPLYNGHLDLNLIWTSYEHRSYFPSMKFKFYNTKNYPFTATEPNSSTSEGSSYQKNRQIKKSLIMIIVFMSVVDPAFPKGMRHWIKNSLQKLNS